MSETKDAPLNEAEKQTNNENEMEETREYELGYHLVPTVLEDALEEEVGHIRDAMQKYGGVLVSEEAPRSVALAYPITKMVANKRTPYTSAHFGSLRFQCVPSGVLALANDLREFKTILRFILIKVDPLKKRQAAKKEASFFGATKRAPRKKENKQETDGKKAGKKEALSDSELDKTIEELVVE